MTFPPLKYFRPDKMPSCKERRQNKSRIQGSKPTALNNPNSLNNLNPSTTSTIVLGAKYFWAKCNPCPAAYTYLRNRFQADAPQQSQHSQQKTPLNNLNK
jgi:hypothetical protein